MLFMVHGDIAAVADGLQTRLPGWRARYHQEEIPARVVYRLKAYRPELPLGLVLQLSFSGDSISGS